MLDEIPSSLLAQWEHYYQEEPFGQVRNDYLLGMLVTGLYNALRAEDAPVLKLNDVLYPKLISATQEAQIQADLAYVEAGVKSGKIIDMRGRRKK